MEKEKLILTDDVTKNIQKMAPLLTERQQYIVFGMILAQVGDKETADPEHQAAGEGR